jgi:DNA polymerase-3 subunit gamma/tau
VGVRADPLVKAVLERFPGAEIVGVRGYDDAAAEPSQLNESMTPGNDSGATDDWMHDGEIDQQA